MTQPLKTTIYSPESELVRPAALRKSMDRILDSILTGLGNLQKAYLIEDHTRGKGTGIIDIVLADDIDRYHLSDPTRKTERYIKRKIRTQIQDAAALKSLEFKLKQRGMMLLWRQEKYDE